MSISVLTFSWNTQSVRIAESLDPEVIKAHRQGTTSTWLYNSEIADFWPKLAEKILEKNPTIVAIGFQEDVRPGSYFHSHLLPEEMPKISYKLFDRTKLMGIGRTSLDGLLQIDPFVRGLRLSVYIKNEYSDLMTKQFSSATYTNSIFQNKGGIAVYVTLPDGSVLAIINTHFPFDADSLKESKRHKDVYIRQDAVMIQNQFYDEVYRKLYKETLARPRCLIMMGDFNYRIIPYINWSAKETTEHLLSHLDELAQYDELRYQMSKANIYPLLEGVENKGPLFAPTCKMEQDRNADVSVSSYSLGSEDQRVPSHCDRILYYSLGCLEYDRFDHGVMRKSDHAGVIGLFELK